MKEEQGKGGRKGGREEGREREIQNRKCKFKRRIIANIESKILKK